MMLREKKGEELGELGIFTNIDKVNVVQECRAFSDTPLSPKRCVAILSKILFLLGQGEQFTEKEATAVFFSATKAFQCKDMYLRRLTYLVLKELARTSQDIIIVTSSLTQDMNNARLDPVYKAAAIRVLGTIVDGSMVQSVERFFKTAMADRNGAIASSALVTGAHLYEEASREAVRRWQPEVQQALSLAPSKSIAQYHALALAYLTKQSDRVAVMKLVQQMQSSAGNPLAACLFIRIYGSLLAKDLSTPNPLDLKPFLRYKGKSDMVALEAARVMCEFPDVYQQDVVYAVSALQSLCTSPKTLLKFAAIRVLSRLAMHQPALVSPANVDIEQLVADGNRNVATLAITTLLKTGNEGSVDRLLRQITGYVSEISDEFKVIVVDAVRSLCLKFPAKHAAMLDFFGRVLREDGGEQYKEATVEAICGLIEKIPSCKETALSILCEFIEDCEYPKLIIRVVHLLGEVGAETSHPTRLVRYIYNRLVLENVRVRVACLDALVKIGLGAAGLRPGIERIIAPLQEDPDDETRDAAVLGTALLSRPGPSDAPQHQQLLGGLVDFERSFDLEVLEGQLMAYLEAGNYAQPFPMETVPTVSREQVFAEADKTLEQLVPAAAASGPVSPADGRQSGAAGSHRLAMSEQELLAIPAFASFGPPLLHSTAPQLLTEPEAEYGVSLVKHLFPGHLVLEFLLANTVRELLICNVRVHLDAMTPPSGVVLRPVTLVPAAKVAYDADGPQRTLLAMECVAGDRPHGSFSASLRFRVFDCDPETGEPHGPGTDESYALNAFEVALCDSVQPRPLSVDFDEEWNRAGSSPTAADLSETFALTALSSLKEAVAALCSAFGAAVVANTDRVDPFATSPAIHTLLLSGELRGAAVAGVFLCRCRLAVSPSTGCTLELTVRSPKGRAVCEAVFSALQ